LGDSSNHGSITADYNFYSTDSTRFLNGWPPGNADCRTISDCRTSPFNQEAHGKAGDPKFVTLPNGTPRHGNWTLQSSSPAINAGADLSSYFTTDLLGSTRSGKWDIGAYKRRN
jgi:hypothetical protein